MKTLRPMLLFISLLVMAGLACSLFTAGKTATPPPATEQPIQIDEPTSAPEPTEPPATEAPATEVPTEAPQAQQFFTEEFDNPLSGDWTSFTLYDSNVSDLDKVKVEANKGKLVWDLNSKYVYYYLYYGAYEYEDVEISTSADNRGKNNNSVSLICRYDPKVGWYEFNIANNGLYNILFAKVLESGKIQYNRIANGGSNNIHAGLGVNEYAARCQGDELTLTINGAKAISIKDKKYGLRSGQVGVSVSSFNVTPILIDMDWFKISQP